MASEKDGQGSKKTRRSKRVPQKTVIGEFQDQKMDWTRRAEGRKYDRKREQQRKRSQAMRDRKKAQQDEFAHKVKDNGKIKKANIKNTQRKKK